MYLTEIIQGIEALSVFDQIAQLLWSDFLEWKDDIEFILAVAGFVTLILGPCRWIKNSIVKISAPYKAYREDIDAVLGRKSRKLIEKYYIPTRGQDVDPCNEEEICESNGKDNTVELITFLYKKAFADDSLGKHYMVLADSGMGKTTFLVNLYRYYVLKKRCWLKHRKSMRYIPLSSENCMESIKKIENPSKTILLLDAMDESKAAMEDCDTFMETLLKETEGFYKIVITCRTHFFENEKKEPDNTGLVRPGTGDKNLKFIKKYIAPFSDNEVKTYLKKRYRFRKRVQKKAEAIVNKVPAIMARPLILSWIDCLIETDEEIDHTYKIYESIINRWIEREPEKWTNGKLLDLSRKIAKWMLDSETTYIPALIVEGMASDIGIHLMPIVAKSRSLLNRNSNGLYKFAHRSFLEYFLAEYVYYSGFPYEKEAYFTKMSGFGQFLVERIIKYSIPAQSLLANFQFTSGVTRPEMLHIPINLGAKEKKQVYHYSFRLLKDDYSAADQGVVEIICAVLENPTKAFVRLLKFEYVALKDSTARDLDYIWFLRKPPVRSDIPLAYYSRLTGINFSTEKYVYTTPILMDALSLTTKF